MTTMKAARIQQPGSGFEIVELPIPEPGPGQVRVRVEGSGICHSDALVVEGMWPDIEYPRVPGHEIAGTVDAVGDGVDDWSPGERVGVGWHAGHCFACERCRRGDFVACEESVVAGISLDGGHAEYTVVPREGLARIPDELRADEAAPLLCAGITTYNALRNADARSGDLVAVQGIGGLGHLALQFAGAMGFETVAISTTPDKEQAARQLGAHHFVDATSTDPASVLTELGGARIVLATAPSSAAISAVVAGLGVDGKLIVVAATDEPVEVAPLQLIQARRTVTGWPSGHARDSQDTLEFAALHGIRPRVETLPLEDAATAYERMISGEARFRMVLEPGG